jgi:hypothetical protein
MIRQYLLTSMIRSSAPAALTLQGDVRPGARIFGGDADGGRAP